MLDKPVNYVDGKPEFGRFRASDPRWTKEIKTITRFFLRPGQTVLYQVDNDNRVAYSRYQIQLVNDDEVKPLQQDGGQQYAQEIKDKRKHNNPILSSLGE
jgi:hypothetical protein